MKTITNKILNNKELVLIGVTIVTLISLVVYNILVHGISPM